MLWYLKSGDIYIEIILYWGSPTVSNELDRWIISVPRVSNYFQHTENQLRSKILGSQDRSKMAWNNEFDGASKSNLVRTSNMAALRNVKRQTIVFHWEGIGFASNNKVELEGLVQCFRTSREMDLSKIGIKEDIKTNLEFCQIYQKNKIFAINDLEIIWQIQ